MARFAAGFCRGDEADTRFAEGDLRARDPKFRAAALRRYLAAVVRLDRFAQERIRQARDPSGGALGAGSLAEQIALWGARHPAQLDPVQGVLGWTLDTGAMVEIDESWHERAHPGRSRIHGAAGKGCCLSFWPVRLYRRG